MKIDYSNPKNRNLFMHHPVIGDPSFDSFIRNKSNPAYIGNHPYAWPVNGSIFNDPLSENIYCYVSLYPETYWAKDGTVYGPGKVLLLKSSDNGESYENLGVLMEGDKDMFDGDGNRPGTIVDSMVVEYKNRYYMLYCWAHVTDIKKIGFGIAESDSPEGPFVRGEKPIVSALENRLQPGNFSDIYEGTLIKRKNDWLILACIRQNDPNPSSLEYNHFCQALIAMTSESVHGPWSKPEIIISPQKCCFLPQPIENGVCWTYDGHLYAPQYSVASNRTYHVIYRAPIEKAQEAKSWEVFENGSVFHAEEIDTESMGLWGQSIHGFVDEDNNFKIMYPAKNTDNMGTINFAVCNWKMRHSKGFYLSGCTAPYMALIQGKYNDFSAEIKFQVNTNQKWRVIWDHKSIMGPQPEKDNAKHVERMISDEAMYSDVYLSVSGCKWELFLHGVKKKEGYLRDEGVLNIRQSEDSVFIDGSEIINYIPHGGAIGLIAMTGTYLYVEKFLVFGDKKNYGLK